jgi:phosphoribosyl-ATP pyrophosphohydrolase
MSDSLERLYEAVIAAKDLDPATSRTARLFQRGPAKMAKKLAEEAIEVVIDAVNGQDRRGGPRERRPALQPDRFVGIGRRQARRRLARDGAARADARHRREAAESDAQAAQGHRRKAAPAKALPKAATPPAVRRRIVALEARSLRKRH